MRKIGLAFGLVAIAAVGCGGSDAGESAPIARPTLAVSTPKSVSLGSGRQVVVFKSSTLPGDANARLAKAGAKPKRSLGSIGVAVVEADAAAIAKLAADDTVAAIGPEQIWRAPVVKKNGPPVQAPPQTPPDFFYGAQWDIRRIGAPQAWNKVAQAAQGGVTVAVIDSGVMSDHWDLQGKVVDKVATNIASLIGCPSNSPDPSYPFYFTRLNFITGDLCEPVVDIDSVDLHGTHVAGTVAGNIGGGVVGVAPGANIAAYKVFDRFVFPGPNGSEITGLGAADGALFEAVIDAALKGRAVINLSLGGAIDREDPAQNAGWLAWNRVAQLATRMGTLIVAAAGNDSANNNGSLAFIPSDLPGVVSVAATGTAAMTGGDFPFGTWDAAGPDVQAFYSNFGAAVNVAAPGGDCGPAFPYGCDPRHLILSSTPYWGQDPQTGAWQLGVGWSWMAGTSMASPHVAGVAALIKAKNPTFTPAQIRARLEQTATNLGSPQKFGRGLVNADLASR